MQKNPFQKVAEKAHAKSFSTAKTPKKIVEPLTRNFFGQLIKLETDFYNKHYTAETLDELTQLYAKAVEYYDTIKDEIASYFIFKIQDALASKKSLKMLLDQNAREALKKSSLTSSSDTILEGNTAPSPKAVEDIELKHEVIEENEMEENSEDEDDVNVQEFKKKRQAYYEKRNRSQRASFSTLKNQKQKFVHFFHKMETHKAQQKQDMHTLIGDYSTAAKSNDQTVKSDLSTQKDRFKAKLEQRKQKSIMTHTLNSSTQFVALRTSLQNIGGSQLKRDGYDNRLEDVLKGLEDEEDAQFEAAGLIGGQPDQSEDDAGARNSNDASDKTPSMMLNERNEKHGLFKSGTLDFSLPMKINDFGDGSNTDSLAFISPRDNNTEQAKVVEESARAVESVSDNNGQVTEPENISS